MARNRPAEYGGGMSMLTIELPAQEEQTVFNLRRWAEVLADPALRNHQGRIETDRHGHVIMFPPAAFIHGSNQSEISYLLRTLMKGGRTVTECPISTRDGVRVADDAWISHVRLAEIGENICLTRAPEICVEVLSPDNSRREMKEKKALYFAAGAEEVWFCDRQGRMQFFTAPESEGEAVSRLCPAFPTQVKL